MSVNVPENDLYRYLPAIPLRSQRLYWVLLGGICIAVALLPLITVDISVTAAGAVRPEQERTELKLLTAAVIERVYCREGELVPQGSLIMQLYDTGVRAEEALARQELALRRQYIRDLALLTQAAAEQGGIAADPDMDTGRLPGEDCLRVQRTGTYAGRRRSMRAEAGMDTVQRCLQSAAYRQEAAYYCSKIQEQQAALRKSARELAADRELARDRVISPKELYDREAEHEQLQAAYRSFVSNQLAGWHQQLSQYRLEYARYALQQRQLRHSRRLYGLRAPVTGTLQGIRDRYAGGMVQAGEVIGTLSPAGRLVGECYVPAKDIGLIRKGQKVQFRIDAFDYRYFGMPAGRVCYMDDDVLLQENVPFFRVRSSFDSIRLQLRNGYAVRLKKGMTFRARFLVARRSLWQLLFDKIDDWLNPVAPPPGTGAGAAAAGAGGL